MNNNIEKGLKKYKNNSRKLDKFSEMVENLENIESKEKILWKDIYENAINDRENAHILFVEAYTSMGTSSAEHIGLGSILTKYLERMNKANDQILKLADLISKSTTAADKINADDIFDKITSGE